MKRLETLGKDFCVRKHNSSKIEVFRPENPAYLLSASDLELHVATSSYGEPALIKCVVGAARTMQVCDLHGQIIISKDLKFFYRSLDYEFNP